MSEQPEALRLADALNEKPDSDGHCREAAAELRRLHEVNQELLEALKPALENICAAKLCEFNSMSSRHEMIRLMDAAITAIREAMAHAPEVREQPVRPYRLLQDNGSKYFGASWDKAEQPAQQEPSMAYKVKMCPRQECASAAKCMSVACSSRAYIKPEQPAQQHDDTDLQDKDPELVEQPHCDDCGGFDPECPLAQPAQQEWPKPKFVRNVDGVPCITLVEHEYLMRSRTSPPASKPWVGLTQQDIDIAFDDTQEGGGFNEFARAIEAKLKEKNNG